MNPNPSNPYTQYVTYPNFPLTTVSAPPQVIPQSEPFEYLAQSDPRTQQQIKQQSRQAEQIYNRNLKVFGIELTPKKSIEYVPGELMRVDVGNQWWAMITDNELQSQYAVFTVHGSPGNHRQWAGLQTQMQSSIRWINFIIPGFDGYDERRGNYQSTIQDLSLLIKLVLQKRKATKIIYCGHSMGSILGGYFINRYPEYVKGYINVTGCVNYWYVGLAVFYRTVALNFGFGRGSKHQQMIQLLKNDQFREKHHKQFLKSIVQLSYNPKVPFPSLTLTQVCAYTKLFSSPQQGCSTFYHQNRKIPLLRFLIFGKNDPLHQINRTNQQIYSITRGAYRWDARQGNGKLVALMRDELENVVRQKYGIQIKADRLQEYFCWHFDETGHNAHKRRPKEISQILKVYITVIGIIEKYRLLVNTKL